MRLDTFLSKRFRDFSRSALKKGIQAGEVTLDGRALRASTRVVEGQVLAIRIAGIAPDAPPPPLPPVLYEADGLIVLDKPAGMLVHPVGTRFAWAVVGLARERWPDIELLHRLDRDTSGCLAMTDDPALNRFWKAAIQRGDTRKEYQAIVKGEIPWDRQRVDVPIGPADGVIRIQMAARNDGRDARTDVTVLDRQPGYTRVHCRIHTGRTHQIRVHLAHLGFPILGDRLYGVPPDVFLRTLDDGPESDGRWDEATRIATGAPHHALHAAELELPFPDGRRVTVTSPWPSDLDRWWADPSVLPHDVGAG
jgi:23S rRNA pseudouridine1911/1915/1917 synthase